jgi:hypothetical protein
MILERDLYDRQNPEQESPRNIGQGTPLVTILLTVLATACYHIKYPTPEVHDIWVLQEAKRPAECESPGYVGFCDQTWFWYELSKGELDYFMLWRKDPIGESWIILPGDDENTEEDLGLEAVWKRIDQGQM